MVNEKEKYFVFNGKKSSDFGVWAPELNMLGSPEKKYERIEVPGRNGDIIIEDGSFENVKLKFKNCFMIDNFARNYSDLKSFLYKQKGYQRLETDLLPDEYRLAAFEGDIDPVVREWEGFGKFDLTFDCKPQRFLKSGEEPITLLPARVVGSTEYYSPKYTFPTWSYPETVPSDAYRVYITLLQAEEEISYKVRFYLDGDPEYIETEEKVLTKGERVSEFVSDGVGWQVIFTKSSTEDADNIQIRIEGYSSAYPDKRQFSGILCRKFYITNPTGFKCRPTIEVYGGIFSLAEFEQIGGEVWNINSNDYSEITNHVILDCENEYMYYDNNGVKKNITGYMTIEHSYKDKFLPQSFPEFGEDETALTLYTTATNPQTEGMMIVLYPHWFSI